MLSKLENLPYFRISHLEALLPNLKMPSLYQKISRWIGKEDIIELKRGFYASRTYEEKHGSDQHYLYYLANILRFPSYVSGASILGENNILTEATYPITSITTKSTRTYSNQIGVFVYNSISPKLYLGYETHTYEGNSIYVATLAKALFDYLYVKYGGSRINAGAALKRERLNLDLLKQQDVNEFKQYATLSRNKLLLEIVPQLSII